VLDIPSQSKEALMSRLLVQVRRSTLPILIVLCLAALTVSYAFADEAQRPLATTVIGDPDAAVTGKFAVGTATPGNKALTVVGVIDFLGAGTVHDYFTQGAGNNMQINTNVDETNAVGDATKSQWKLVMGSSLDWFSIRRSPASGTYNEDALFFIQGSTGNVGIATVDTGNGASIPFTPLAKLHVSTPSGDAVRGETSGNGAGVYGIAAGTSGTVYGVWGWNQSTSGAGAGGYSTATTGTTYGVTGRSDSTAGIGVRGEAEASSGTTLGVTGVSASTSGRGVYGLANAATGSTYGVYGQSDSPSGVAVFGWAVATTGANFAVYGVSPSTSGTGVFGLANATTGATYGVSGEVSSSQGIGVEGWAKATTGSAMGVRGRSEASDGIGVYGYVNSTTGTTEGVHGESASTHGTGVVGIATATTGTIYGIYGQSGSNMGYGVYGVANRGSAGVRGDSGSQKGVEGTSDTGWGVWGEGAVGVYGVTTLTNGIGVQGYDYFSSGSGYGVYGRADSPDGYGVYSQGNMGVNGNFTVWGTKSAIVETQDYGWRNLYAMESPQNWFEDFGQATLTAGEAVVSIEPVYAQTVNLDKPYHVFLTPRGDCGLYVAEQTTTSFTVRALNGAACEITFDYRIIAARLDYEDLRLKPAEAPQAVTASIPEVK
jgi:hypothetical protein